MKSNIARLFFFGVLVYIAFGGTPLLFIVGAVIYIFMYMGMEIIILAATIDAYFGYGNEGWFVYTIGITCILLFAQWIKPHLSVYNQ